MYPLFLITVNLWSAYFRGTNDQCMEKSQSHML